MWPISGPAKQVWSYPIYKYEMESRESGNVESVSVTVYFADDAVEPDYRGTQVHIYHYTYDLFLDGNGAITGGEWTGPSIIDHPELLSISLDVGTIFPGLDYQEIVRLAGSKDDFLENGSAAVEIGPGTYNLILLDEDVYTIPSTVPGISCPSRWKSKRGVCGISMRRSWMGTGQRCNARSYRTAVP